MLFLSLRVGVYLCFSEPFVENSHTHTHTQAHTHTDTFSQWCTHSAHTVTHTRRGEREREGKIPFTGTLNSDRTILPRTPEAWRRKKKREREEPERQRERKKSKPATEEEATRSTTGNSGNSGH